ncbi:TetR/AcrR family transcriptional regulator [Propioniciclava sp. MC1683]|uniref:TetR/AcrR family transcriptional regulator n=1 Tax=Propioniciclava sp. MC1683 TaxID=2760309 RepID=UPI0016047E99|nr:TetR/AcrR family transcriptional regulator [Propioniciclava sp. MC1683]MBB1499857.1 TetR/AcrR family transcriptional regulator [Propioniciclava sp. MC1683]
MVRHKNYPDDLRERLVAVMLQHLRTQDPDDVSLRDLAAECDTSTNAVYSIFGSKDALIDEVARVAREDFLRPQFELADDGEPTIEALQASGALYRAWARANPGLYRLMFVGPSGSDYAPRAAMVEPIRRMLHRLQVAGVLAPHDADTMALSLWATTHGFVMLEMDVWPEGSIDTDALFEAHLSNSVGRILLPVDVG